MNWNAIGRGSVAALVSAALGFGTISCSRDFTVAYVYATASTTTTTGAVDGYLVDYQSGALTQLANSPTNSGGRNPVTLVAAPSGKYIYVLNSDDNNVVQFAVGTDGKIYPQNTYNVVGSFPVAAAIDSTGTYLYVASTLQPGFTRASPGPGTLTIFPINPADGTLDAKSATSVATGNNPIGVASAAYPTGSQTHQIYVADRETTTAAGGGTSPIGYIQTFTQTQGSSTLTRVTAGETAPQGVRSGVQPSGIAVDPTARFLYVTDSLSNQVGGYRITASGLPQAMVNGPFATGQFPSSLTIDPRAKYLYVTNYNAASVTAFTIDQATGNLAGSVGSSSVAVKTNPTCVAIEPALGIYLYTSNNGDQTISGLQLSPNNGTLKNIQNTPYPATSLPTCLVAVANGQHASQVVNNQ